MTSPDPFAEACARGQAAWPALPLPAEQFAQHLSTLVGAPDAPGFSGLAVEDLFLARACAGQIAGAADAFRAKYRATIRAALGRVVPPADVDELEQQFLKDMLLGGLDSAPKIGSYGGRAPLDRWVAVAAQRVGLASLRHHKAEARARTAAAAEPSPGDVHPEIALIKGKYRGDFQAALMEALGRLPERDRLLLKLHLVNGVPVEKIGQMFSVTQPTASRWLAAARDAVRDDIEKTLEQRLGTSSREVMSLAGMVASQLELSISHVLGTK